MKANPLQQAIIRACTDEAYRARLLAKPQAALLEEGIAVPSDVQICVHESRDDKLLIVLPGPQNIGKPDLPQRMPNGPVADVPNGLTLEWNDSILVAVGRIDSTTAPAFKRELLRAAEDIDVDLAKVVFMSSAGLSALLAGQQHLNKLDCRLRLMRVPETIENVLEMAGFLDQFEIAENNIYFEPMMMSGM